MSDPTVPPSLDDPATPRVRHRAGWIVFVVLGAIFCCAMGYWQLSRFQSASGTAQNLGYTFMWPFLAGFLVYTYLRYVKLEAAEHGRQENEGQVNGAGADGDLTAADVPAAETVDATRTASGPATQPGTERRRPAAAGPHLGSRSTATAIPDDLLPTRIRTAPDPAEQDETLRAYNDYLADLHRRDTGSPSTQETRSS